MSLVQKKAPVRQYGILLHISSLPSAWGIGDLGPAAHAFARTLAGAGATVWQFLPLHPTSIHIGNSPYSSISAFAGNPLFISPEWLVRDGYLSPADLQTSLLCVPNHCLAQNPSEVNFGRVSTHRGHLLYAAFERNRHLLSCFGPYQKFCREQDYWLHDYARFVSLKNAFAGSPWVCWPEKIARRVPEALAEWDEQARGNMEREKFIQFLFFSQWAELRRLCNNLRLSLLADVPMYVTHDSADVWGNSHYFNLDEHLRPIAVSGVPPDSFSETGQRWGTPVYRWDALEQDDFCWWKQRLGHILSLADMARLDHFRGFCGYWEIPAQEKTAIFGQWKKAPAEALFTSLQRHFGALPFLAEDLGVVTQDVRQIMQKFHLSGTHVLQFAFGAPHALANPCILSGDSLAVYTGTHDNSPTRAWFHTLTCEERENFSEYAGGGVSEETATRKLVCRAFSGVAELAVLPMQDALNLGEESRMNIPGAPSGNWGWRMTEKQVQPGHLDWLARLAALYGRLPE